MCLSVGHCPQSSLFMLCGKGPVNLKAAEFQILSGHNGKDLDLDKGFAAVFEAVFAASFKLKVGL